MGAPDISLFSLFLCFLLLLIPVGIILLLRLKILRSTLVAVVRMTAQLFLAGLYLTYLFQWNHPLLNLLWLVVMVLAASFAAIRNSDLRVRVFLLPAFASFVLATLMIVLYFNRFVIRLDDLLEAKYLVVIGGMLLGNSLRGNIIGISNFYKNIHRNGKRYRYHLALGATRLEAILPYFKEALTAAVNPTIATMMTIGIVSLPGMMTGQMLGGSDPLLAIKYQIAIMVAIFVSVMTSVVLIILFTLKSGFDAYGILRPSIFANRE